LLRRGANFRDRNLAGAVQHRQQGAARTLQFVGCPHICHPHLGQHFDHAGWQPNDSAVLRELDSAGEALAEASTKIVQTEKGLRFRLG
jgi:hypothetical protein